MSTGLYYASAVPEWRYNERNLLSIVRSRTQGRDGIVTQYLHRKFSYYTTYSTVNAGLSSSVLFDGCVSQFPASSSTTIVARANNQDLNTTVAGGNGPITMWAQPLTVQFQSNDLSLYATASSTSSSATTTRSGDVSAASATTGSTASLSSASQTSTPSATATSSPGLSTGAQAGIGVGVSLGALAVIGAVIAWWLLRRRKTKAAAVAAGPYGDPQPMTQHHPYELDGNARSEMDGLPQQPVHKKTPMSPVEMGS